jgi:hypothetical protein
MDELYPVAEPLESFVSRSAGALAGHGFEPGNCLALVGVCRDELMFETGQQIQRAWGPTFDLSSLAAMVFLGRSGMQAAAHHAPDDQGRRRFVVFVLPHVGIDVQGQLGWVNRAGQTAGSSACGALVKVQAELAAGLLNVELDPHDLELSLLRLEVLRRVRYGQVPELPVLTEIARQSGVEEATRLTHELVVDAGTDVALVSGTVVHGPDGDLVAPAQSWVSVGGADREPLGL